MSDIRLVTVPSGLTQDGSARVRVLVVPRLDGGALADFGLDDWPALLASATFELAVDPGDGSQIVAAATVTSVARSEIWQAFFSGDGGVIDDTVPGRTGSVNVHPRHDLAVQATGIYRQAAVDMAAPDPPAQPVGQRLAGWQVTPEPPPPPPSSNPAQPVSFNRVLATVRQHPAVLETLGLIFELSVSPADLRAKGAPAAGPWQGRMSLRCPEPPLSSLVTSPWTSYELTSEHGFWPASGETATPRIEHGAIDLSQAQRIQDDQTELSPGDTTLKWSVATFDVDGALRGLDAAKRAAQTGNGSEDGLPGLRSAGLVLMRRGRQRDVNSRLAAASHFDGLSRERLQAGTADEVLSAEDLLLGYRVDIRVGDEPSWRSLCKREATYKVNGLPIGVGGLGAVQPGPPVEEGHVSALTAGRDDHGDLHADEIVLHWIGWSLAVPGISLLDQRDPASPDQLPYNFAWQYRVPDQSLPSLRFGQVYRMRIRAADVTGGGLGEDAPDAAAPPTGPLVYLRHDPIQPPRLSVTGPLSLGPASTAWWCAATTSMAVAWSLTPGNCSRLPSRCRSPSSTAALTAYPTSNRGPGSSRRCAPGRRARRGRRPRRRHLACLTRSLMASTRSCRCRMAAVPTVRRTPGIRLAIPGRPASRGRSASLAWLPQHRARRRHRPPAWRGPRPACSMSASPSAGK